MADNADDATGTDEELRPPGVTAGAAVGGVDPRVLDTDKQATLAQWHDRRGTWLKSEHLPATTSAPE